MRGREVETVGEGVKTNQGSAYGGAKVIGITRVTTVLTPDERLRVDAAGLGLIQAWHRESVEDVWRDLRSQRIGALIVSTAMCRQMSVASMARMVREFPRVPTLALLSRMDNSTVRTVLSLGHCGIRTLIDVRDPGGWHELRSVLLNERAATVPRMAESRLDLDLEDAPSGARRFFGMLFAVASSTPTIRELARRMGVIPGTLMSRFFRAGLPAPKRFLTYARLTYAAHLFENPGVTIASVADQLDYSSPQSFGRHVRAILQLSAVEFRARYDATGMLECLRERLVLPYLAQWREFDPFGQSRGWVRRQRTGAGKILRRSNPEREVSGLGEKREDLTGRGERDDRKS